ncbi:MAG: EscU/YscU/HrcU family type III secretion system export apparatus switch protein [Deltaproteobacteria bacterium]|nr:EscU/YscU/HrcU family type III secretion system export apparatus switch protein [Deltaproteobacteria bacterium]
MEKTEKPTPDRLKKAREEGQTFYSRPFESYIKLIAALLIISVCSEYFLKGIQDYFSDVSLFTPKGVLLKNPPDTLITGMFYIILLTVIISFADILIPFIYRPNLISPNVLGRNIAVYFKNINPSHLFSKEKFSKTILNLIKISVFLFITLYYIKSCLSIPFCSEITRGYSPLFILAGLKKVLLFAVVAGLIIGVSDMLYERHKFTKSLYMTKQEIKEEYKNQEGDPEIKQRQKRFRQMILFSDIKRDVKRARFLLVNPTHIAIPIIYSQDEDTPCIGYIGVDEEARKMITLAASHSITIVKNIRIAREFYRIYEPGDEINEEHYEVIASIISLLITLENRIDYIDMDT